MGRWSYARLRGHNGSHIFIITAYMVCKTSISTTGPTTAFRQQYSILRANGNPTPNPRHQFLHDLELLIHQHLQMGDRILLLGGFNTDLNNTTESRSIHHMLQRLQLQDVLSHHHHQSPPPPTRRNDHRIDSIYACTTLTPPHHQMRHGPFQFLRGF